MQYESCLSKSRPRSMSRWSWSCPLLRFLKKMVLLPRKRLLQVLFFLMVHTALLCDKQNVLCLQCNTPPTLPWYAAMLMFETHELCSRFTWSTAANLSPSTFQDLRLTHTSHEKKQGNTSAFLLSAFLWTSCQLSSVLFPPFTRHQLWAELTDVNSSSEGFASCRNSELEFDHDTLTHWIVSFSGFSIARRCEEPRNDIIGWIVSMFSKHSSSQPKQDITHETLLAMCPGLHFVADREPTFASPKLKIWYPQIKPLFEDSNHPKT